MLEVDSVAAKQVGDYRVLYVMATRAEYLDALASRITPLICHVGPVEAALNLGHCLARHKDIDLVVSLGSAGSARLEQAEVYQVSKVSYRDMDASPLGFAKGETPFLDFPGKVDLGNRIAGLRQASISTGANIVAGDAYNSISADMVDMETWSIMRACYQFNIPMIGLRGISDGAHPVEEYSDWTRYLHVVDHRLAEAVDRLEAALLEGELKPTLTTV
ncbi:MAG: 5'-methylthioadenosine/S-adenosylhomocysteine nucleosidase [Rhizobiaceae bacterium]